MAAPRKTPTWAEIASFYAGRPVDVLFDHEKYPGVAWGAGGWGGTFDNERQAVNLGPFQRQQLAAFLKNVRDPTAGPGSVAGIATLLHEAVHGRTNKADGLKPWSDENQANALGSELVGDLLQRFFGIPINSKLSRQYMKAAKNLSGYQGAYAVPRRKT